MEEELCQPNKCKKGFKIINKKHGLCQLCNEVRLGKEKKIYTLKKVPLKKSSKPIDKAPTKKLQKKRLDDKSMYAEIWNERDHVCEECGISLGEELQPIYFSHILSKKAYPELRHNKENINLLCPKHHHEWEFTDRQHMAIYGKNQHIIEKLRMELLKEKKS